MYTRQTRTYPAGHGFAMLVFLEELWPSAELVCAARTMPEELAAFLREASRPELTVLVKTPETAKPLEELAPFTEAYPIPETGVRYLSLIHICVLSAVESALKITQLPQDVIQRAADDLPIERAPGLLIGLQMCIRDRSGT